MRSAILFRMLARSAARGLAPGRGGGVRGVERELDVLGGAAGDLAEGLAVDRRDVLEVLALDRGDPLAADPVVVAGSVGDDGAVGTGCCVHGHVVTSLSTEPAGRFPQPTSDRVSSHARSVDVAGRLQGRDVDHSA